LIADVLRREFIHLWFFFSILFEQIFIYWALGVVLGSTISVFGKEKVHRLFGAMQSKKLGAAGVIPASVIGIISPLCMYGTVPIAAAFSSKGMRDDWLAAFMMSSILLNPQLVIYSAALGRAVLAMRIVLCLICGAAAGLLIRLFYTQRDRKFFRFSAFEGEKNRDVDPSPLLACEKHLAQREGHRPFFPCGCFSFGGISAIHP